MQNQNTNGNTNTMEWWRSKVPLLIVILTLALTAFSLTTYEAPTFALPEAAQQSAPQISLPKKVDVSEAKKTVVDPKGSKSVATVKEDGNWADGTYYGIGTGFRGAIKVKVVIKDGKIASISVVSTHDDGSYFNRAKSLLSKIVYKQSTNVDTVSGATYSSAGLIKAVRNALAQASKAGKNKDKKPAKKTEPVKPGKTGMFPYPDGVYEGTAEGFASDITVAVTIKDKTMTKIKIVSQDDDVSFFKKALGVVDRMIRGQRTDVDAVSGATFSSRGIINAVIQALEKAKEAAEAVKPTDETDPTQPSGENDPTDSTDPNGQTDPTDPSGQTDPTDPSGQTNPDDPSNTDPTEATDPTETTAPQTVYVDGSYFVTAPCYCDDDDDFDDYEMSMTVTIKDDKITDISGISGDGAANNKSYINAAKKIVSKITAKGSPDGVDTVSGATCSSKSILQACRDALAQAKR